MSGLKSKFWIDACVSMRDLTNQTTTFWMDLLQSTLQNEAVFNYNPMDISDIESDLPDIMMITSDADIPDLDDVSDAVCFT